ncbi:hypothetical protein B0H63DRAFT_467787 [Podospora didyma]|uniref:Uncharacterized protein n=1 Tax=Podospora didyma TaxID=330526 RepID=A0AAE0U0J7_9PEZI|nr:hypothetical protein B0H63DRAFT_467787 [Podospora didyma]
MQLSQAGATVGVLTSAEAALLPWPFLDTFVALTSVIIIQHSAHVAGSERNMCHSSGSAATASNGNNDKCERI